MNRIDASLGYSGLHQGGDDRPECRGCHCSLYVAQRSQAACVAGRDIEKEVPLLSFD